MSELDTDLWDREDLYERQLEDLEQEASTDLYEDVEETESEVAQWDEEEYDLSDIESDLWEEEESLVDEAIIRLEQGRLYQMLINHNLFDGVEAVPQVVDKVQTEIKSFIKDRLQILVGMKSEKEEVRVIQESQFNDVEVQALRMIASKVTKGASEDAPTTEPKVISELNTVKKKPKSNRINALGGNASKTKATPKPVTRAKPVAKAKKERPVRKVKKEIADVSTEGKSASDLAKRDMKYIESLKTMSVEEANDVVSQRHSNRRMSSKAINQEHVNAHYANKMATNDTANTFKALLAQANHK